MTPSPPRPDPVQPPRLRPVRRDARRCSRRSCAERAARGPARAAPRRARHRDRPGAGSAPSSRRSRSSSSATAASSSPPAPPSSAGSSPTSSTPSPWTPDTMSGSDLTILVALAAGLISFLSPCVLPLVPAYLGQLTAIAVAGVGGPAPGPSRWLAVRHAARLRRRVRGRVHRSSASPRRSRPARSSTTCRRCAIDRRRRADRARPQPRRDPATSRSSSARGGRSTPAPSASLATATGTVALGSGSGSADASVGDRLGRPHRQPARRLARVVRARRDLRGRLDAVHRHHPRRDPDDGRDLRDHRSRARSCSSPTRSGWAPVHRASRWSTTARRASSGPLVRHGQTVSLIGGLLVAVIGVAMVFDLLSLLPRYFNFNTAI